MTLPLQHLRPKQGVYVCPVFECNAVARPLPNWDVIQCVNGHQFTGLELVSVRDRQDLITLARLVEIEPEWTAERRLRHEQQMMMNALEGP